MYIVHVITWDVHVKQANEFYSLEKSYNVINAQGQFLLIKRLHSPGVFFKKKDMIITINDLGLNCQIYTIGVDFLFFFPTAFLNNLKGKN